MDRIYIAIDLKSFYASVECVDRGLDPLKANLVVADLARTEKTICLAVSPSLKAKGIPGRPRLFEVIQKVKQINAERLRDYRRNTRDSQAVFSSSSSDADELERDLSLGLSYIVAVPRMNRYMDVSSRIYGIYLKYAAAEDIIVYSIDEVFIDATPYLNRCSLTAEQFAMLMIREILGTTGITATAGIGTNLFLAKVAMDIVAKHAKPDEQGVRMARLDEMSFRRILWNHKPLTDFWRVGPGLSKKLQANGMYTMGDVARMSCTKNAVTVTIDRPKKGEGHIQLMNSGEDLLYKLLGVNAELLIDHAWGWEPCTVGMVKQYRPGSSSLSSGQVLHEPYDYEKARIIVMEMADDLSLELVRKKLVTDKMVLYIGYDKESLSRERGIYIYSRTGQPYRGKVITDPYGRQLPQHAGGSRNLDFPASSSKLIVDAVLKIFQDKVDPGLLVRRVNVAAVSLVPESQAPGKNSAPVYEQLDFFTDYEKLQAEQDARMEVLEKERRLQMAMLTIRDRYGKNAVLKGTNYREGARGRERNAEVGGHRA